jgi:hypothetical protein
MFPSLCSRVETKLMTSAVSNETVAWTTCSQRGKRRHAISRRRWRASE